MLAFLIKPFIINNMNKNNPIGFIDSGIGGLTVVKAAQEQLPNEQFMYIGDTARMPYGPRPAQEVIDYTFQMANFLIETKNIKLLVIACNTATARALPLLQTKLPIPVIGVIQSGAEAAVRMTKSNHIGLIATQGTVTSGIYEKEVANLAPNVIVQAQPEPDFVTLVENDDYESEYAQKLVADHLSHFGDDTVDTLILGCTHFPLLAPFIQAAVGSGVKLVDAGAETVKVVRQYLDTYNLHSDVVHGHDHDIYHTTGDKVTFQKIATNWLSRAQPLDVRHLVITNNHLEDESV